MEYKSKNTRQIIGTSYHGYHISITPNQLIKFCKEQNFDFNFDNTGKEKVNLQAVVQNKNFEWCTVYDWKEYEELNMNMYYEFHIGGHNEDSTVQMYLELKNWLINKDWSDGLIK